MVKTITLPTHASSGIGRASQLHRGLSYRAVFGALFSVASLAFVPVNANATCPTFHTLTNGTSANATDVMDNFNYVLGCPNFTGNVGIGVPSPAEKLDVDGNIHFGTNGHITGDGYNSYFGDGGTLVSGAGTNDTGILTAGNIVFGTNAGYGNYERVRITSDGRLYVNQTAGNGNTAQRTGITYDGSSEWALAIKTTHSSGNPVSFQNSSGTQVGRITTDNTSTGYITSSDRRIKENIADTSAGLAVVVRIPVRDFNFIADSKKARIQGFIAQELYDFYPEAVTKGGDNPKDQPWGVDYGRMTPLLVKAVQELKTANDNLAAEITKLKAQNTEITALKASMKVQNEDLMRRLQVLEQKQFGKENKVETKTGGLDSPG